MAFFNFHVKKFALERKYRIFFHEQPYSLFFKQVSNFFYKQVPSFLNSTYQSMSTVNQCRMITGKLRESPTNSRTRQGITCDEVKMAAQQQSNLVGQLTELVEVLRNQPPPQPAESSATTPISISSALSSLFPSVAGTSASGTRPSVRPSSSSCNRGSWRGAHYNPGKFCLSI